MKEFLTHRELSRKGDKFDGRDGITILSFLERLVEDVELVGLSEAQALIAVRHCLAGSAKELFSSAAGILPGGSGIASWPEAVQYLLQTYATDLAIERSIEATQSLRQQVGEDEKAYSARFTLAEQRCGNVHRWRERKLLFIDGLTGAIKPLVARYNRQSRQATYLDIVEFAYEEGVAHRARGGTRRNVDILKPQQAARTPRALPLKARGSRVRALAVEPDPSFEPWASGSEESAEMEAHVLQYSTEGLSDLPPSSIGTPEAVEAIEEADPAMMLHQRQQRVRPPGIPFADRRINAIRPGWVSGPIQKKPEWQQRSLSGLRKSPGSQSIAHCYRCYFPGHMAPDCSLDIAAFAQLVVANFERLPPGAKVPSTSYWHAKTLLNQAPDAPADDGVAQRAPSPKRAEYHPKRYATGGDPNPTQGEGTGPLESPRREPSPSGRR